MADRLALLRKGTLSVAEIADFVADAGNQNYIEARPDVERLLDHESPTVRYEAMGTIAYEWGICSRVERIIEILLTDENEDCRRQAAGALGSLFRGKRERRVLDPLVRMVKNAREARDVRAFAYTGALDVIGVPRNMQPSALRLEVGPDELLALDEYLKALQ